MYTLKISNNQTNHESRWSKFSSSIPEHADTPKIIIFAAGETGCKFLSALTFLTAGGYFDSSQRHIVPIIIEPDESSIDRAIVTKILKLYSELHKFCVSNSLFSMPISPIGNNNSFFLEFDSTKSIFDKYDLGYSLTNNEGFKALTESLWGTFNTHNSILKSNYFVRDSAFMRIILEDIENSDIIDYLRQNIDNRDVFIITGSTIGATGSASLYKITKYIKNTFPSNKIAIIPFLSYNENGAKNINTKSMSKDLLSFFNNINFEDFYDKIYYIGASKDTVLSNTHKTNNNIYYNAHICELLAVMSVRDFINNLIDVNDKSKYISIPKRHKNYFCIDDFLNFEEGKHLIHCLIRLSISLKFIDEFISPTANINQEYPSLKEFSDIYINWIDAMNNVEDGNNLNLFNFHNTPLHKIIANREYTKQSIFSSILHSKKEPLFTHQDFQELINKHSDKPFLLQLSHATDYIYNTFLKE